MQFKNTCADLQLAQSTNLLVLLILLLSGLCTLGWIICLWFDYIPICRFFLCITCEKVWQM